MIAIIRPPRGLGVVNCRSGALRLIGCRAHLHGAANSARQGISSRPSGITDVNFMGALLFREPRMAGTTPESARQKEQMKRRKARK